MTTKPMPFYAGRTAQATPILRLSAALLMVVGLLTAAEEKPEIAAAKTAAESWVALIDSARYEDSYDHAASVFRSATTKTEWAKNVKGVRDQTGKLKTRALKSAEYKDSLPDAPAGKYVVIEYNVTYEQGPATEVVVLMLEKDGSWRVSGYFIRPVQ